MATPAIGAALDTRAISALKDQRQDIAAKISGPFNAPHIEANILIEDVKNALFVGMLSAYTQGMNVIVAASQTYDWGLQIHEILRIWRGGCIIRGDILEPLRRAYARSPELSTLLLDDYVAAEISVRHGALRRVTTLAIASGLPCPALTSSISYLDSMRCTVLPTNLIQAQRDFFGAHMYERTDAPGKLHTHWKDNVEG